MHSPCCSRRGRLLSAVAVLSCALGAAAFVAAPAPFHPHFPKVLECRVAKDHTLTLRYQTVTFDRKGAEAMVVGKAWHLAGATFATTKKLVVGGREVEAGEWALSARKTEQGRTGQTWELVLHPGNGFGTKIGDDAHVLATTVVEDGPLFEHLSIDVQPGGDKKNTQLFLDVRFDTLHARSLIELLP
jgi:hypothetical protein